MRIIFLASGAFAQPTLHRLAAGEHDIAMVVTQPARGSGRGQRRTRTPVRATADELGLPAMEPEDINAAEVVSHLQSLDARLGVVIAFGQKLGTKLLATTPGGFVNLHASLLPKYRGAAPINWAIVKGEQQSGCTVFRIVERMDAGPILTAKSTPIQPTETAGELHDRLAVLGVDAVLDALSLFEADAAPTATQQNDANATHARKLAKSDGIINFDRSAKDVANHIRGMTPWPAARARYEAADGRWEDVTILRARVVHDSSTSSGAPGTIDGDGHVATAAGSVELLEVKPSAGRRMTWKDYANGRRVSAGDKFVMLH